MKLKKQTFTVDHGTYPFDIIVYIAYTAEEVIAHMNKKVELTDEEKDALDSNGDARTAMLNGGGTVIQLRNPLHFYPQLAHEVFHAVEFLFNRIGIPYDIESSESWAYQIQYVTGSILEKLDEKTIIKNPTK